MYAITGITGNVGGETARALLAAGRPVRAVVRDPNKGVAWAAKGCVVTGADLEDSESLARAFAGAEGVFAMIPPVFDPGLDFPEARAVAASLYAALERARPGRVVYLSTIGAQAKEPNLLTQHAIIETALRDLPLPITFLRPGWFMENFAWDVASAREKGTITSFLQPLDRRVPMVATADIGELAAGLLAEDWRGHRVVELEGPTRVSPQDAAAAFSELLGREVRAEIVPRSSWESLFRTQGMKNPGPRIRMLDGFNEGWIEFDGGQSGSRKGKVDLKTVLKELIERKK